MYEKILLLLVSETVTSLLSDCHSHDLITLCSTDLDEYFQMGSSEKGSEDYSFFVLPHESSESNAVDAYVGKYSHCILYNNKGRMDKCDFVATIINLIINHF